MSEMSTQFTKFTFAIYVTLGFLISLVIFQLLANWIKFFAVLFEKPNLGYHNLPSTVHYIQWALPWMVWLVLIAIFAVDWRKRSFVRSIGYFTGIVLAALVSFIIFWFQFSVTMSRF